MKVIDRELFFQNFPFRPISQSQFTAISFLLDKLDGSERITRLSEYAYVLATIKHETAETYRPIMEMGSQTYLRGKRYYPWIGRGYVQLTWGDNYKLFGRLLNLPLYEQPDLALERETAWKILDIGMSQGLYTGKKLSDYFNDNTVGVDATRLFVGYRTIVGYLKTPRRIINGTDQYRTIGDYAIKFYNILQFKEI